MMKGYFLILSLSIIFFSCKKSTDTPPVVTGNQPPPAGNPTNTDSGLSITINEHKPGPFNGQRIITELTYDTNQWPLLIRMHSYDTLAGIAYTDSFRIVFQNTSANSPPKSYDISWMVGTAPPAFGATEHHLLYYDNQNRVVKDSSVSTTWLDLTASLFTYSADKIMVQRFDFAPSQMNVLPFSADTLTLTSGNISGYISYYLGGNSPEFVERDGYTPSTFANPLFQAKVANSLGAMLRFTYIGFSYVGDFISPVLMNQWSYTPVINQAPTTLNYTWSADASGKVILGTGTDPNGAGFADIYTFQYK